MRRIALAALLALSSFAHGQAVYFPNQVGPTGAEGAPGPQGETGPAGLAGAPGVDGPAGLDTTPIVATYSPSAADSVDIVNFVSADCIQYRADYQLAVSADDKELYARISTDGGTSWHQNSTDYKFITRGITSTNGGGVQFTSNGAAMLALTDDGVDGAVGNGAGEHVTGSIWISHLGSGSRMPMLRWETAYLSPLTAFIRMYGGGIRVSTVEINGLQIYPEGSPTTKVTGEVRVYCLRNANAAEG